MILLFVDLLGVRSRWHRAGREGAAEAFQAFRNVIAHALKGRSKDEVVDGIVETDAAAITCSSIDVALEVGRKLYHRVFEGVRTDADPRFWLRGCIVPRLSIEALRRSTSFNRPLDQVILTLYEADLFEAIAVEKSGIKGMRLLVDESLVTTVVTKKHALKVGRNHFIPFKHLRSSNYPGRTANGYLDYLWMATEDPALLTQRERTMARRLRLAAADPEEFLQAAATQVLFHECIAMIGSIRTRQAFQEARKRRHGQSTEPPNDVGLPR